MNVYSLLKHKGVDLNELHDYFCKKKYYELYNDYTNVINNLLLITSKDEFDDFIEELEEAEEIEEEAFLLALAFEKGLCCSFGMYEENVGSILQQFLSSNNEITIDYEKLNENSELLVDCIKEVNNICKSRQEKYIILFDGTYYEGCYYIFEIPESEDDGVWESELIERIL